MTNVLIVEDEPAISDMERDFLEGAGYNPFIAENSEEALHMMRSEKIDAVILDVTLPGEDGFSLCRKLREITNVPILFAAARTEDSDMYCLQAKNLIFSISLPHIPMKYFQKSSCSNRYGA